LVQDPVNPVVGDSVIGLGPVEREKESLWRGVRVGEEGVEVEDGILYVAFAHESCLVRMYEVLCNILETSG